MKVIDMHCDTLSALLKGFGKTAVMWICCG